VRLLRHDGVGGWNFHNEIIHSFDQDYTNPDGFGTSIALDGLTMVAGEPDGAGFVSFYNLPTTSHHTDNVSPDLAGFNGVAPSGSHFGLTFDGFPNALEILNARPLATAFLVIGVSNLSANFKGGVLFPSPDFIQALPLDGSGSLLLPYFWSAPPGAFTIYAQYWVADVDGPVGFSATGGFTVRQDF